MPESDPFRPPNYVDPATNDATTVTQSNNKGNESNTTSPKKTIIAKRFPLNVDSSGAPYLLIKIFEIASQQTIEENINSIKDSNSNTIRQGIRGAGNVAEGAATIGGALIGTPDVSGFLSNVGVSAETQKQWGESAEEARKGLINLALRRNISELQSAIALLMPDGLAANYEHTYDEFSMTSVLGGAGLLAQALQSETGGISTKNSAIIEGLSKTIVGKLPLVQSSEQLTNTLIYGATGRTINPQLELLYTSPRLRTFTFDFLFVPRSEKEAKELNEILYLLRFYAAPTIPEGTTGRFMIPPAQFELEFYHKNAFNNYLFKTKKCVLESLSYDYAPNGYASFRDGFPVQTRLQMMFKETVIMDRNAISAEKNDSSAIESKFIN